MESESLEFFNTHQEEKPLTKIERVSDTLLDKVMQYKDRVEKITSSIKDKKEKIFQLQSAFTHVCTKLYQEDIPPLSTDMSLDRLSLDIQNLEKEKIAASSNYPGDWTLALRERMRDPLTKQKFIETRKAAMIDMQTGEVPVSDGLSLVKPEKFASYYQKQIDEYDVNIERVFNSTDIGNAEDFSQQTKNLGVGRMGYQGAVFDNATKEGMPLSARQKNIIESHEKGHGLRDFVAGDSQDFKWSLDYDVLEKHKEETGERLGYILKPEEIAERMAQLKNYFGFGATDIFTKEHLEYARTHYVADTGLDNNMSLFFKAITENTLGTFLKTINSYPL